MKRRELETVLGIILRLMEMLLPYINPPDLEQWSEAMTIVTMIVFETNEEA